MISGIHSRAYNRYPSYAPARKTLPRFFEDLSRYVTLTATQKTQLLALVALAVCAGLCFTGVVGGQIASARSANEQAKTHYLALDNEYIHLLAIRADLSSRERIGKLAGTRFQLFEPGKEQIQHL